MEFAVHNLSLAALVSLINILYFPLNLHLRSKNTLHTVKLAVDDKVPHIDIFYIPYVLSLGLIVLGPYFFSFLFTSSQFVRLSLSLVIDLIASFVVWYIYPCKIHPSAKVDVHKLPFFARGVKLYGLKYGNANSFPSAHVSITTLYLAWLCIYFPAWIPVWIGLEIVSILSVICTHQHYIIDVLAGLALAVTIFAGVFLFM